MKTDSSYELVAFCGLFCENCKQYKKKKCPGCSQNNKATWCKIRSCCISKNISSCALCDEFSDAAKCNKYNNFLSKTIELFFRTSRPKSIDFIRKEGIESFILKMQASGKMGMPKTKK